MKPLGNKRVLVLSANLAVVALAASVMWANTPRAGHETNDAVPDPGEVPSSVSEVA